MGKAVPALFTGFFSFLLMLAVVVRGYHIPMRGSLALLTGLTLLEVVAEAGWGLMISAAARTQQQSVTLVFVWAVLAVIFSGYLIPIERLPWALRAVASLFPLRHYMVLVRGVMLKGAGLGILWPEAAALLALSAGITFLTTRIVGRV